MENVSLSTSCENIFVNLSNSSDSETSSTETEALSLLDPTSETFNPVIALHAAVEPKPKNVEENEEVRLYLHVHEFIKAVPDPKKPPIMESALKTRHLPKVAPVPPVKPAAGGEGPEPFYPIPGRRFLPHQLPVYRPRKQQPSVLTNMEAVQGPLALLRECMNGKEKVVVWTRSSSGIRGFCLGAIQGFDMHWNLALGDVVEVFQRRRPVGTKATFKPKKSTDVQSGTEKDDSEVILADTGDALLTLRKVAEHTNILQVSKLLNNGEEVRKENVSSSQLRKKRLCIFKKPEKDVFGFDVIARSQKVEIVQRRQRNLFLMGNEVAFVEREKT